MNKTEYIGKLNALYVGEKNCLEELIIAYDEKDKEIERLNNIINELEKYLNEQVDYMTHHSIERMVAFDCCRHRLQELKGSEMKNDKRSNN